jgi:hypothetical protein
MNTSQNSNNKPFSCGINKCLFLLQHVSFCFYKVIFREICLGDIFIKHKFLQVEGKDFPVHTMKAYRGSKGIAPQILNLGTIGRSVSYAFIRIAIAILILQFSMNITLWIFATCYKITGS